MMWPSPGPGHAVYGSGGGPPPVVLNDGDTIVSWPDSSSAHNNGIGIGTPIFKKNIVGGKPVVRLSSATHDGFNLTNSIFGGAPWTIIVVMKKTVPSSALASLYSNNGYPFGPLLGADNVSIYLGDRTGFVVNGDAGGGGGAFHVFTGIANIGALSIWMDGGGLNTSFQANTNSFDFQTIGYGGSTFSDGDIAELLVCNQAIPSGPHQDAEKTLSVKYGTPAPPGGNVIDLSTLPGLVGWWKADSLSSQINYPLADGAPVSLWPDSSGLARDGLKVGNPIFKVNIQNGLPAVRLRSASLDGFNLVSGFPANAPCEMLVVMKPATPGSDIKAIGSGDDSGVFGGVQLGAAPTYIMTACANQAGYITPNNFSDAVHVFDIAVDLGAAAVFVDGNGFSGSAFAQSLTANWNHIGYQISSYSDGDLLEIWYWNRLLLTAGPFERQGVQKFLGDKYGLPGGPGPSIDPATITNGLMGSWRADTLLNPQFTTLDTTVSGDNVRIMIPKPNKVAGTALIWCHGLGGNERDITTAPNTNYTYAAMGAGHLVAACNGFGYNWDNPTAQAALEALVAYLKANYGVTRAVLIGGSAGSPLGLLKATQGFTGVTVPGWHGIFPIVNLDAAEHNASLKSSIDAAFPGYPTGASGRDPILFPASAYNGLRLRCCQSPADTVAPKAVHGDALVTLATGHATEVTCVATTGDHGDPSNFTPALVSDFISFIGRCLP